MQHPGRRLTATPLPMRAHTGLLPHAFRLRPIRPSPRLSRPMNEWSETAVAGDGEGPCQRRGREVATSKTVISTLRRYRPRVTSSRILLLGKVLFKVVH